MATGLNGRREAFNSAAIISVDWIATEELRLLPERGHATAHS